MNKAVATRETEAPEAEKQTGTEMAQHSEGVMLMDAIQKMCSNPDFDPAKMQQIIDMRKEMFLEQARIEFNAAMARAQADIQPIMADAYNKQTDSYYAKLPAIVGALAPIYTREGFSVSFGTSECASERLNASGWFRTTADLEHIGGYTKHYHVDLPLDTMGPKGQVNKTQIHGAKSAISYARVILMGLMFNFTTALDVDDDGNGAGKKDDAEPITDEQTAIINEYIEAGTAPQATIDWLEKREWKITESKAKEVIAYLKGIE